MELQSYLEQEVGLSKNTTNQIYNISFFFIYKVFPINNYIISSTYTECIVLLILCSMFGYLIMETHTPRQDPCAALLQKP